MPCYYQRINRNKLFANRLVEEKISVFASTLLTNQNIIFSQPHIVHHTIWENHIQSYDDTIKCAPD